MTEIILLVSDACLTEREESEIQCYPVREMTEMTGGKVMLVTNLLHLPLKNVHATCFALCLGHSLSANVENQSSSTR